MKETEKEIEEILSSLAKPSKSFTVKLLPKKSAKVLGDYVQNTNLIRIYNATTMNANMLWQTILHEYAHHLVLCAGFKGSSHSDKFWATLDSLLKKAEDAGIYKMFGATTNEVASKAFLDKHRQDIIEADKAVAQWCAVKAELLVEVVEYCTDNNIVLSDIVNRYMGLRKKDVKTLLYSLGKTAIVEDFTASESELLYKAVTGNYSQTKQAIEAHTILEAVPLVAEEFLNATDDNSLIRAEVNLKEQLDDIEKAQLRLKDKESVIKERLKGLSE